MMMPLLFALLAATPYQDRTFQTRVFGQERHYRLFLPAGYEKGTDRYPVIYYFHGHSDRHTLERYDDGKDTVPKIARFVAANPVIVVSADGSGRQVSITGPGAGAHQLVWQLLGELWRYESCSPR